MWDQVLRKRHPGLPAVPRTHWQCTAVRAAASGLPRSLDEALVALGHPTKKDPKGKRLIRIFCQPRKPTKKDPRLRFLPQDRPEEFLDFIEYCRQDVRAERALDNTLPDLLPWEWSNYHYCSLVNDRGLPLDIPSIEKTATVIAQLEHENHARVAKLTGGLRPTQRDKVLAWLGDDAAEDLKLRTIEEALKKPDLPANVREVLELRLEASKASTKKVRRMAMVACADQRARGTLMFYGAHTGRFAGKLIQPHNFTRGLLTPEQQINVLESFSLGNAELVKLLYEQPMHMLSQSMRGFIRAPEGERFIIADYAQIEMRVLAWWANEVKLLSVINRNLTLPKDRRIDVYILMATVLYHVAYAKVTKEQRRIGKNLRLGAQYQLGADGLIKNCDKEGIPMEREMAEQAIRAYREDNPGIVQTWYSCEDAAIEAMQGRAQTVNSQVHFARWKRWLIVTLPSGRRLHYFDPKLETVVKFKKPKLAVSYFAGKSRGPKTPGITHTGRAYMYGGKWVENIVQAIAFDLMLNGMRTAEQAGYPHVLSVHDENISLRKNGEGSVEEFERLICTLPRWAKGIPIEAEGFECERYRKG